MESLASVIDKFFVDCTYGTRKDVIDYIDNYVKTHEVFNKQKRLVKKAPRTTIYDNLDDYSKISVKQEKGASFAYFFKAGNEEKVKLLLKSKSINFGSSDLNLDELIGKFFEEQVTGTRSDIISFVKKESGKALPRTTVYYNLNNVYSFGVVNKLKGRSVAYYFKPEDEAAAKPMLLDIDKRAGSVLKDIENLLNKKRCESNHFYYTLLKTGFEKSAAANFNDYLLALKSKPDELKELIWGYYLNKK